MDLISQLMDIVKETPDLALWVIAIVFAYKSIIVGSIYGVVRYCVGRCCDTITDSKQKQVDIARAPEVKQVDFISKIGDITISNCHEYLIEVLLETKKTNLKYLHRDDVDWLKSAIEEKKERERKQGD